MGGWAWRDDTAALRRNAQRLLAAGWPQASDAVPAGGTRQSVPLPTAAPIVEAVTAEPVSGQPHGFSCLRFAAGAGWQRDSRGYGGCAGAGPPCRPQGFMAARQPSASAPNEATSRPWPTEPRPARSTTTNLSAGSQGAFVTRVRVVCGHVNVGGSDGSRVLFIGPISENRLPAEGLPRAGNEYRQTPSRRVLAMLSRPSEIAIREVRPSRWVTCSERGLPCFLQAVSSPPQA